VLDESVGFCRRKVIRSTSRSSGGSWKTNINASVGVDIFDLRPCSIGDGTILALAVEIVDTSAGRTLSSVVELNKHEIEPDRCSQSSKVRVWDNALRSS